MLYDSFTTMTEIVPCITTNTDVQDKTELVLL